MPTLAPNPAYGAGLPTGWTVQNALSTNEGGGDQNLTSGGSAPQSGLGVVSPSLNGLAAWSFDPRLSSATAGGVTATSGTGYLSKFYWTGGTMTYGWVYVGTGAVTPTHGWLAVYDMTGTQWVATADQTSSAFSSTGQAKVAFATATSVPAGYYYGYFLGVASTAAKLAGITTPGGIAAEVGLAAASGNLDFATLGSALSALPASLTLTSQAADTTLGMWFGVS